tara:strand:+ start:353 stop:511 length:159 start_codon:yes stop_codon:yes gene_type:complete
MVLTTAYFEVHGKMMAKKKKKKKLKLADIFEKPMRKKSKKPKKRSRKTTSLY